MPVQVDIGQPRVTVARRLSDYYKTPLVDRRPRAGGHWIKTLAHVTGPHSASPTSLEGGHRIGRAR